jgi:Ser/Thr protein kinase RdoA (MazF antagonist)
VAFEWVPGVDIGGRATRSDYEQLGELSARLHQAAVGFDPPGRARRWDRVWYYPEELDPVVVWDDRFGHIFDRERRRLIEWVIERADPILARLCGSASARLVHGDLHPWNVHRSRNRLHVLDFEDAMVAAPIQDIAVSLFYNRDRHDHPDLVAAFRRGYEERLEWPDEDPTLIPTIMAARTVMFMNFVAKDPDEAFFIRATDRLRQFVARPDVIPLTN